MFSEDKTHDKIRNGAISQVSNPELFAIITGKVSSQSFNDEVDCHKRILAFYGSYENLREVGFAELCSYKGMDEEKAMKILCAMEISKRTKQSFYNCNPLLDSERAVIDFVRPKIWSSRQEVLYIMFLSNSLHLKGLVEFSRGTDNEVHFYTKELMRAIINGYSSNIVLIHNHIEESPVPSEEDIELTKNVMERCEYFDVRLLDHFIVSKSNHVSLKRVLNQKEAS